jgi:hypothetical protein
MPAGKPAGVRCAQLDAQQRCRLFGRPERPAVCTALQPAPDMCGPSRRHAMRWLTHLEASTAPRPGTGPDLTAGPLTPPRTAAG